MSSLAPFPLAANERQSRVDWLMLGAIGGLMIRGYNQPWVRQVIWYGAGACALAGVCFVDYRIVARWSLVIYFLTILMLIVVLIPSFGSTQGWGARRWIDFGPFS